MFDIWAFENCNYIEVTTKNDQKFTGYLVCMLDETEFYDELDDDEFGAVIRGEKEYTGKADDQLTIKTLDGSYIAIWRAEVVNIVDLSEQIPSTVVAI